MTAKTIAIANAKGGTGKTTTAICLALSIHRTTSEPVRVVDADSGNISATTWIKKAAANWPAPVTVTPWPAPAAPTRTIIDVGPADRALIRQAVANADLHILPMGPSPMDLQQLKPTLAAVQGTNTPTVVLLTKTRQHAVATREIRAYLDKHNVNVATSTIHMLDRYALAAATAPENIDEYDSLAKELNLV